MRSTLRIALLLIPLLLAAPGAALADKLHCPNVTDNDEKNTETARRYFQMGGMFLDKADYTKAAESFECVLKFVPYSLTARYKLAKAYDGMELYSKAREQYELILVYDSKDAETIKPEIRRRLAEIKDLKDKTTTTPVPVEAPSTDEKTCPSVVQKNLQEALGRVTKLLDAKDWAKARTLIEETLGKLTGATQEQRTLCHATDAGLSLLIFSGIAHFNLGNLETARENLTAAFRVKSDVAVPQKYANARLLAFQQETLNAYFELVKAEKARLLRIQELEELHGVPVEPAANPAIPVEHAPPVAANGKPLVIVCRVQDQLGATAVKLVYRADGGPARELSLERLGVRRYAVVLPAESVTFARFSYHLVALSADGRQAGLWASPDSPHQLVLRVEKPVEKPVDKPVDKPIDKPVDKPPVKAQPPRPPRFSRFFLTLGAGGELGYIASDKETLADAVTDNNSFGGGPAVFSLELGYHLAPAHRLGLLFGFGIMGAEGYEDGSDIQRYHEDLPTFRLFLRYAYSFGSGRLRPFAGVGIGAADLYHQVRTETDQGNDLYDAHQMAGVFTNLVVGAQVCLTGSCGLFAHAEVNQYWNLFNAQGEDRSQSNLAIHFLGGLGVRF